MLGFCFNYLKLFYVYCALSVNEYFHDMNFSQVNTVHTLTLNELFLKNLDRAFIFGKIMLFKFAITYFHYVNESQSYDCPVNIFYTVDNFSFLSYFFGKIVKNTHPPLRNEAIVQASEIKCEVWSGC